MRLFFLSCLVFLCAISALGFSQASFADETTARESQTPTAPQPTVAQAPNVALGTRTEIYLYLRSLRNDERDQRNDIASKRLVQRQLERLLTAADTDLNTISSYSPRPVTPIAADDPVRRLLDESFTKLEVVRPILLSSPFLTTLPLDQRVFVGELSDALDQLEQRSQDLFETLRTEIERKKTPFSTDDLSFRLGSGIGFGGCNYLMDPSRVTEEDFPRALSACKDSIQTFIGPSTTSSDQDSTRQEQNSKLIQEIRAIIQTVKDSVDSDLIEVQSQLKDTQDQIASVPPVERFDSNPTLEDKEITANMIITIAITLSMFGLIIAGVMYSIIRLSNVANAEEYNNRNLTYPIFVDLVTIFLLTVSILILGLAGKINNEALAALIGGISGYVLGRIKNQQVDATLPKKTPET